MWRWLKDGKVEVPAWRWVVYVTFFGFAVIDGVVALVRDFS